MSHKVKKCKVGDRIKPRATKGQPSPIAGTVLEVGRVQHPEYDHTIIGALVRRDGTGNVFAITWNVLVETA